MSALQTKRGERASALINDARELGRIRARAELVTQQRPGADGVRPITSAVAELQGGVADLTDATTELVRRLEPLLTPPGPERKYDDATTTQLTQFGGLLLEISGRMTRNTEVVRELLDRLAI